MTTSALTPNVARGTNAVYTITVSNNGPSTATNVQLTVAYTVCNGGCAEISHSIISPLGTIAPGVTVSGGSTGVAGANAEHQVQASVLTHIGYGGAETDTNPANNIAEDTDAVI